MELGVLGPLQVRQYGLPVSIPGAKPRAILTMLGLHADAVVSADTLLELLWGDEPPRTAAKALQTHISSLRRTLGDGFVLTQGTGWTLSTTEIDASRYKVAEKLGRDAFATGDVGQAAARFDEALALWRGIPELPDGPRGASEKTRWIEGHAALVEDRADALLASGRAAEIIGELEAAVGDAPLRERRWAQLILALYRAGRQGEALGAYQRARSLLADELGVDPGPDLRRLETAIVAQDESLEIPVSQQLSVVTRAVTFLLTDIEGSTAAWEADADAMAVALARHDEIVEQVVTSGGGRLVKTRGEGDATFSVFDRPSAAAAAAIELQEAIRHEPWTLAEPMRIRVALHTGEVELRDGDYFGRAVNRAARLRSLALGGQILCSGATAELVIDTLRDDVVLADLGMRQLKNLARPEHVFELRLETADDSRALSSDAPPMERPDLPAVLAGPGPFVGRGHELERLLSAWQTTLDSGTQAVLIAGEPGVGKTRLAGEWSRQAYEQGAVVLYGRCDEDLGAPYQPFAEALRSLVPCLGSKRLRGLRGVESLLPLIPGLTDELPDLAAPARADADTERYALFDAVVALLGVASKSAPVVLILDDLHWAAKPTLLLLRHLLRFGERARVQIVGTYRSTDLDRSHPLAAMLADLHRDGSAHRLALGGLDEDDVTAYVSEAGYDDEELARALASVTGGNPFFLIEALRHVDESGGRWDPSTLPQGVREAVSRRLSRLPAETNKALAAAAVVGSRFALDLVERVTEQDLVDAFDEACKAGIVIEEPGGRYRFNHALVRQSLLAELASVRRMRLHQRIATTLETESGADDELLAELAYHYFECAWAGNAVKAVEYCRRAADQAMARLAYEGAADYYDKALHALDELDDELPDRDDLQAELLVARCEALLAAGDVVSARGAVSQLQSAAGDSARLAAWGACFDGELSMLTNPERLDEIESAVAAAAEKLAGLDDAAGEAKAHTVRATCLGRLGRIGDCETALDQALTAARRAREHRRVNNVLANAPLAALWGPNPVPRAGGRCLDVVRLLRITTGSPVVEATSTRCQGVLDAFRGRAAAGRQLIESARRSLTELGMRHALLEVEQFAGIVELVADDPASAEPHFRRAYNGFRRMSLDADTADTAALLARVCLALDRDAEADELCTESERLAGHALKPAIAWRTVRARLLARRGEHDEARRVAEEAVTLAARTDALVDHGDACLALAMVLKAAGDDAGARDAAEQAVGLYEQKGAAALAEKARNLLGERDRPAEPAPRAAPPVELDNECVRALRRLDDAVFRAEWDEVERLVAANNSSESRRKIVGFTHIDLPANQWVSQTRRYLETARARHHHTIVAVRGERLALTRFELSTADDSPGAPHDEMLQLYGLDDNGRIAMQVLFDPEDIDAAIAELDALHAREELTNTTGNACVRAIRRLSVAIDREDWAEYEQMFATDVVIESRRKIVGFQIVPSSREWAQQVRRLRGLGAERHRLSVIAVRGERLALTRLAIASGDTHPGAPQEEVLELQRLDDEGRFDLVVFFDVEDMDAAIAELDAAHARFEGLPTQPPLENMAHLVLKSYLAHFQTRDWAAMAEMVSTDFLGDDRRRVVNGGVRRGRDAEIDNNRAIAGLGSETMTSTVIATRGERLVLNSISVTVRDWPEQFSNVVLEVTEINADNLVAARINFDPNDIDAAFAELDARYLAGEAAPHSHTWSVVAEVYATLDRKEMLATTSDWVNVDRRRTVTIEEGGMKEYLRAMMDTTTGFSMQIVAVHRLSDLGVVVTHRSHATSQQQNFDAEWQDVNLLTVDGGLINRAELFDEADLDAALARFDELSRPTPQLENKASRAYQRALSCFAAADWQAMAKLLSDEFSSDDRRKVVNAGIRRGTDAAVDDARANAELGIAVATSTVVATRGERLALARARYAGSAQGAVAFHADVLDIIEINTDEHIVARVTFGIDEIDTAFAELDARYLDGEATAYAHTWSLVAEAYAAFNRRESAATTPDWVNIDHRRGAAFAPGDMIAYLQAAWDDSPDTKIYIAAVHMLSHLGAVITHVAQGISQDGFDAEWRDIHLLTVTGELLNRCELFDEADLETALARFDELRRPARRPQNAATQARIRVTEAFNRRDLDAMAALAAVDGRYDDRRVGFRDEGPARNAVRALIDTLPATWRLATEPIAIRGSRLGLTRDTYRDVGEPDRPITGEHLTLTELDENGLIRDGVLFDPDDYASAFQELEARYLAGEAAPYARTWSAVAAAYAALNRQELPARSRDFVDLDHRRGTTIASGDLTAYLEAAWENTARSDIFIEAVHRLSRSGAVVTHAALGTTGYGFDAEWRITTVLTVDGDLVNRVELFDEADLDAALARFDQLSRPAPRLENAASRRSERLNAAFAARDWSAMAETLADDFHGYDRRQLVSVDLHGRDPVVESFRTVAESGVADARSTVLATRGERLVLTHVQYLVGDEEPDAYNVDLLQVVEIDGDERIAGIVTFDPDDSDSAFEELDARYLAGEAGPCAHTWSAVAGVYAALNRREMPATTDDHVSIDRRRTVSFAPGDIEEYTRYAWDQVPDISFRIEAVHRLSEHGAVVTQALRGTSREGFEAEWREIHLITLEGDLFNRSEMYDEDDLDAALARLEELSRPASHLENAASRMDDRFWTYFAARDWAATAEILADDVATDDRRRVVNVGPRQGRDAVLAEISATAEAGVENVTSAVIATRGERLVVGRVHLAIRDQRSEAYYVEVLLLVEVDADDRIATRIVFDADDIDAAIKELETRYAAGEAAAHAHTWSLVAQTYAGFNRRELHPVVPNWESIDHRRGIASAQLDAIGYAHAAWDTTPDVKAYVETIHQLSNLGAVVTAVTHGTSADGFEAEWRDINLVTFERDMVKRFEFFDEDDLDAALVRFDELNASAPALENVATGVRAKLTDAFNRRDLGGFMTLVAADGRYVDRRKGLHDAGSARHEIVRGVFEAPKSWRLEIESVAVRGSRLGLTRERFRDTADAERPVTAECLMLTQVSNDDLVCYAAIFDADDIDAAFAELDARYIASEAAAHAHTWSAIASANAAFNRREMPPTTPDWVNVDHRRGGMAFAPGDQTAYIHATWDVAPHVRNRIVAVHRLGDRGAAFTQFVQATSREGFNAEWRDVVVMYVDGEMIKRCEMFDEEDLETALAAFDCLGRPAGILDNKASRAVERFAQCFASRDWNVMAAILAGDVTQDDRRRVVGSGLRHGCDALIADMQMGAGLGFTDLTSHLVATRGARLALTRTCIVGTNRQFDQFHSEMLAIAETDAYGRVAAVISFDPDDIDAAFAELDARYLAGEAAPHATTWSAVTQAYAALNRHELPTTTSHFVHIDHHRVALWSGDFAANMRAAWEVVPDWRIHIAAVHRLTEIGTVITCIARGASQQGFDAEQPGIAVLTVEGGMINRFEYFDEADLDAALARFDELERPVPR